jgi:hypothetical protein
VSRATFDMEPPPEVRVGFGEALRRAQTLAGTDVPRTVPVVAVASVALDLPVVLRLGPEDVTMVAVIFEVSAFTLAQGRTNIVQGAVHLVLFAGFLFLALMP